MGLIKMAVTDLDGTLLDNKGNLSAKNRETLLWLGEKGVVRVVATGRNYFSFNRLNILNFPIDYLLFSSGSGIMNFHTREILHASHIPAIEVSLIIKVLLNMKVNFMIHDLVPDNHRFLYYDTGTRDTDFHQRIDVYKGHALPLTISPPNYSNACQALAIIPPRLELLEEVRDKLNLFRIIRTSSPLDGKSIWVEIFPHNVSKGHGVSWLCKQIGISEKECIGIGNDYNDLDMLETVAYPFVVKNAPDELKQVFPVCPSNIEDGFSHAVKSSI